MYRELRFRDSALVLGRDQMAISEISPESPDEFIQLYKKSIPSDRDKSVSATRDVIQGTGVEFFIQIAACRDTLAPQELERIYQGKLPVLIRQEDGWFKYQIGQTSQFSEAKNTLLLSGVKDAFIVPYLNNQRLVLWDVLKKEEPFENESISESQSSGIQFVVQIAASRDPLTDKELRKIYADISHVRVIQEDGWNKYQIPVGNQYAQAHVLWKNCSVKGAFLAAYLNQNKIAMTEAIQLAKNKAVEP